MIININDDFELNKIADSGQCFRVKAFDNGMYRFVTKDSILYISKIESNTYEISCSIDEWESVWKDYFDFGRNYRALRDKIDSADNYLLSAADFGKGIRILRQDPWEMLISFIISQRKSIPAIKKSVEAICAKYGKMVTTEHESIYLFPSVEEMIKATEEELADCSLGYRTGYIIDAIRMVSSGTLKLDELFALSDQELLDELLKVKGVGIKVANCVGLFAYNRVGLAPIDTWILKVINDIYSGINPFPSYGEVAGIMQQYIFYYAQGNRAEKLINNHDA